MLIPIFLSIVLGSSVSIAGHPTNETLLQYFHWDLPNDGTLWNRVAADANDLSRAGITSLWLPPATKGAAGSADAGYGVYDRYDLGEFLQKGSVRTKYGTKAEYENAIRAAHASGLKIYADAVMNHQAGGDFVEAGTAIRVNPQNRLQNLSGAMPAEAYTGFRYSARADKYSAFHWRWDFFSAVDSVRGVSGPGIFLLSRGARTGWNADVDPELGNYDFLLMNDLDLDHPEVREELKNWGRWSLTEIGVDGFRVDAIKHMSAGFMAEWARAMVREKPGAFIVGEYWSYDLPKLSKYIEKTAGLVSLFDFTLQSRLQTAGEERGYYDLSRLYTGTWTERDPAHSVTFADNHDTWREKEILGIQLRDSFKAQAYSLLLLKKGGVPSIFLRDWTGKLSGFLRTLAMLRRDHAYGEESLFFDDRDVVGWTRAGDPEHPGVMAVVLTDSFFGTGVRMKRMKVGKNKTFRELTGNFSDVIRSNEEGFADFPVRSASDDRPEQAVSVWVESASVRSDP